MKCKPILTIIIFLSTVIGGCQMSKKAVNDIPEPLIEDHESASYTFEEGVYYSFVFPEGPSFGFDQIEIIKKVLVANIDVDDIWYKSGASGCRPPGSDMSMSMMVEPVLLVLVDKEDKKIETFGFIQIEEPSMGGCAYVVKRYKF